MAHLTLELTSLLHFGGRSSLMRSINDGAPRTAALLGLHRRCWSKSHAHCRGEMLERDEADEDSASEVAPGPLAAAEKSAAVSH